ncbi:MAG: hypothetical protein A2V86_14555 [Deltaproteobacteria bacterium RBG_16_49_23]|nr:MAG: hypothetical protein A2V86_14555 [Deltaproteobacteria bacterium RBG_16_49_23]
MQDKIKLFLLIDTISGPNGGTEKHVLQLIRLLNPDRFQVYFGSLYTSKWLEENPPACWKLILNFKGYRHPNFLSQFIKLARFLRRERIKIIQTFFLESNIIGVLAGRLAGVPVKTASRRNLGHRYTPFRTMFLRTFKKLTTCYIANCDKVRQFFIKNENINPRKIKVIYNGVDQAYFRPGNKVTRAQLGIPGDKLVIGMVANLKKIKGIDFFMQAAKLISQKRGDVIFVVIGGEYEEEYYHKMRAELGLKEVVQFLGIKADVRDYLNAFDLAVNSSLTEGFSNSILEYMACGLPVVATDVGGNPEAVIDGQSGIIVPAGDSERLARAMETLLNDGQMRKRMGEKGRQRIVDNFSQSKMISEMEKLYLDLARAH